MPKKTKLTWWEWIIAVPVVMLLVIIFIFAFLCLSFFVRLFAHDIVLCFKRAPRDWKTESDVQAETGRKEIVVFLTIMWMERVSLIERRLSEELLKEHNVSAVEKADMVRRENTGHAAFNAGFHEYRWQSQGGKRVILGTPVEFARRAWATQTA